MSISIPDNEPQQIVCTGEDQNDQWHPAFGYWEADEFGLDSDQPVGNGERLYVNRRLYDAQAAEIERLREMTRKQAHEYLVLDMQARDALAARAAAEAEVARLRALLTECADDLATYVEADYPLTTRLQYRDQKRKYERDMDLVRRARAALTKPAP